MLRPVDPVVSNGPMMVGMRHPQRCHALPVDADSISSYLGVGLGFQMDQNWKCD